MSPLNHKPCHAPLKHRHLHIKTRLAFNQGAHTVYYSKYVHTSWGVRSRREAEVGVNSNPTMPPLLLLVGAWHYTCRLTSLDCMNNNIISTPACEPTNVEVPFHFYSSNFAGWLYSHCSFCNQRYSCQNPLLGHCKSAKCHALRLPCDDFTLAPYVANLMNSFPGSPQEVWDHPSIAVPTLWMVLQCTGTPFHRFHSFQPSVRAYWQERCVGWKSWNKWEV